MAIYIQKIKTNWTKKSRGFPDAKLRNNVPEVLPFDILDTNEDIYLQEVEFNEDNFQIPIKHKIKKLNEIQLREHRLDLTQIEDKLHVGFWTENQIRKKTGILSSNSWCQIKTNRRYAMEKTWGYYKIVYNIFFGSLEIAEDILNNKRMLFEKDYQSLLR